jgi:GNAT superfamily N-acetyltransferase
LAVEDNERNKGLGTKIMDEVIKFCDEDAKYFDENVEDTSDNTLKAIWVNVDSPEKIFKVIFPRFIFDGD